MSDATYIDPLELPFTKEELLEALRLWVNDTEAVEVADQFAETARIDMQNRARRSEQLHMVRRTDGERADAEFRWLTPEWLLPTLSVLSDDCAERVTAFMEPYWRKRRKGRIELEIIKTAERAGLRPTHAEMLALLAKHGISPDDVPKPEASPANLAIRLIPLPEPTPEDIAAAERFVAEERQEWNSLVKEASERLANRRRGKR